MRTVGYDPSSASDTQMTQFKIKSQNFAEIKGGQEILDMIQRHAKEDLNTRKRLERQLILNIDPENDPPKPSKSNKLRLGKLPQE